MAIEKVVKKEQIKITVLQAHSFATINLNRVEKENEKKEGA